MLLQMFFLIALSEIGHITAGLLALRVPGNMLGMLLLLALLLAGAVPLRWVEPGAALLVRHLAFFFIPIAVGLMSFGPLFAHDGPAVVAALVASTMLGLWAAGWVTQRFLGKGESDAVERTRDVV
jgi:holin-like protein